MRFCLRRMVRGTIVRALLAGDVASCLLTDLDADVALFEGLSGCHHWGGVRFHAWTSASAPLVSSNERVACGVAPQPQPSVFAPEDVQTALVELDPFDHQLCDPLLF